MKYKLGDARDMRCSYGTVWMSSAHIARASCSQHSAHNMDKLAKERIYLLYSILFCWLVESCQLYQPQGAKVQGRSRFSA